MMSVFKFLFPFLIASFLCKNLAAQMTYSLDDDLAYTTRLENETRLLKNDSSKTHNYFKLSVLYKLLGDTTTAKSYLQKGLNTAKSYPFLNAVSHFYKAHAQYNNIDVNVMLRELLMADSLLSNYTNKTSYKLRGMLWHNYAVIQQTFGHELIAMESLTKKAAVYAQLSGHAEVVGGVFKGIAIIHINNGQAEKAQYYLKKAIALYESAPNANVTWLEELTEVYLTYAENLIGLQQLDSANYFLNKARIVLTPKPNANLNIPFYNAEGLYYTKIKQYKLALQSFDKGIALCTHPTAAYSLDRIKHAKYKALVYLNDFKNAELIAKELIHSPYLIPQNLVVYYNDLSELYFSQKKFKEAMLWSKKYKILNDSLSEKRERKKITELEFRFNQTENEKKIILLQAEKQKIELSQENNRLFITLLSGISLLLLTIVLLSGLYYRNNKKLLIQQEQNYQQQLNEIEQKRAIHFSKALIEGEEKERKRLASDLHDGLGGLLAIIKINLSGLVSKNEDLNTELKTITSQLDNTANELRRIARNMMPEALINLGLEVALKDLCHSLFTEKIKIDFQSFAIQAAIPKEKQIIIFRIVQELLTNAIRHAKASSVLVQCSQNETTFFITVEDNGVGFKTNHTETRNGIGLLTIKNRVDYLNGTLEIHSIPQEGTTINIELNVSK